MGWGFGTWNPKPINKKKYSLLWPNLEFNIEVHIPFLSVVLKIRQLPCQQLAWIWRYTPSVDGLHVPLLICPKNVNFITLMQFFWPFFLNFYFTCSITCWAIGWLKFRLLFFVSTVWIEISPLLFHKNTCLSFFPTVCLNLQTVYVPFLGNAPYILFLFLFFSESQLKLSN